MDLDEIMSDVPDAGASSANNTSSHGGAPKNGNTPSGSGDDAPSWNTKKFRDECMSLKLRMTDLNFSFGEYPDPLLPRPPPLKQPLSGGSAETIRQLHELVANIRAEQSRG